MYKAETIFQLSNQLSINDMITLINCFSENIHVHKVPEDSDQMNIWACSNGHSIQINCKELSGE